MPTTILIGAVLVIAALYGAKTLTGRLVRRDVQRAGKGNNPHMWQPDLHSRREEHREYLRERAKNDRHQDLD